MRDQPVAGYVAQSMDDNDPLGLDGLEPAPVEQTMERLALMSREEAHDLLRLLATVAEEGGPLSAEAERLAREIAARIPSEN
ncbi:hypothetical protein GCM10010448_52030 [Streptomyces glomeratus]|uniref:Uncharacterized protein n=2 Tax=Streptomyces TaxID=1883 RepID=A0ABP6LUW6_9ACTN